MVLGGGSVVLGGGSVVLGSGSVEGCVVPETFGNYRSPGPYKYINTRIYKAIQIHKYQYDSSTGTYLYETSLGNLQ